MSVLGTTSWAVTNGDQLNVLIVAVPKNKDGTECSPGNSGSLVFKLEKVALPNGKTKDVIVKIGTASAYDNVDSLESSDPSQDKIDKAGTEIQFSANLDGYDAVCGYSYETVNPKNMVIATVVNLEAEEQAKEQQIAAAEQQFQAEFFDPNTTHHLVNGIVYIPYPGENGGGYWVKDPAYEYDPTTQTFMLGFSAPKGGPNSIFIDVRPIGEVENLLIYSPDGETVPDVTSEFTGTVTQVATPEQDSFLTNTGQAVGEFINGSPVVALTQPHRLSIQNGQLVLENPPAK